MGGNVYSLADAGLQTKVDRLRERLRQDLGDLGSLVDAHKSDKPYESLREELYLEVLEKQYDLFGPQDSSFLELLLAKQLRDEPTEVPSLDPYKAAGSVAGLLASPIAGTQYENFSIYPADDYLSFLQIAGTYARVYESTLSETGVIIIAEQVFEHSLKQEGKKVKSRTISKFKNRFRKSLKRMRDAEFLKIMEFHEQTPLEESDDTESDLL
jgi:hypothetical protein